MENKTCKKCGSTKPVKGNFRAICTKPGNEYYSPICKACRAKEGHTGLPVRNRKNTRREYYLKNREKELARAKQYHENNREKRRLYKEKYREENQDKIKKAQEKYWVSRGLYSIREVWQAWEDKNPDYVAVKRPISMDMLTESGILETKDIPYVQPEKSPYMEWIEASLTPFEREVMDLVSEDYSPWSIAQEIGVDIDQVLQAIQNVRFKAETARVEF